MKANLPLRWELGKTFTRKQKVWLFTAGVLLAGLLAWSWITLNPLPPRTIILACGPEGSAYEVFGKRYQALLAKQGIQLKLLNTAGGVENLARLRDPYSGVQAGFVEGGLTQETDDGNLASLGTICYEPLWVFTRQAATDRVLFALRGKRVSIGPEGSSSYALVNEIFKRYKMDPAAYHLLTYTPEASAEALLAGRLDGVILVNSYASPIVRKLVKTPGINLANFSRADAFVALFPSLTKRNFPAGVGDLENNRPPMDTTLLAAKTSLIVRSNLHPAIQFMLLETAAQVHSRPGIFQKSGEFPAAEAQEIPLSSDARHYYKSGRPLLQRYLPFWLAALVEQLVLFLIPVLGLMYPLIKSGLSLYGWGMQRRIFSIYRELHRLEQQIERLGQNAPAPEILAKLRHLEERTRRVRVSSPYMPMLYSLRDTLANAHTRLAELTNRAKEKAETGAA